MRSTDNVTPEARIETARAGFAEIETILLGAQQVARKRALEILAMFPDDPESEQMREGELPTTLAQELRDLAECISDTIKTDGKEDELVRWARTGQTVSQADLDEQFLEGVKRQPDIARKFVDRQLLVLKESCRSPSPELQAILSIWGDSIEKARELEIRRINAISDRLRQEREALALVR